MCVIVDIVNDIGMSRQINCVILKVFVVDSS